MSCSAKVWLRAVLMATVVGLLCAPPMAAAYLTDGGVYPPINYAIFVPPESGGSYIDPTFGTTVKRITSTRETPNAGDIGNLPFISHEYSTMSPFNADNSRLLVLHHSYFALYDGQGYYIKDLTFEVNASSEPRWSREDPNVFYYLNGNELKRYDVFTDFASVVRTFNEYTRIRGLGESDISYDGDHLVLVGDDTDIFEYTLSTDTKGPALDTTGTLGFDNVYITPDNNVLVGWFESGTDRYNGVELYDQNMNFLRQVAPIIAHMDVTRDVSGEEVLLWANAADPSPPVECQNAIVKIHLSDGARTCLISFPWGMAKHVSAVKDSEWFVVSTYTPSDPAPVVSPIGSWTKYANEVLRVKLDGSETQRLAHHRSRPFNDYYYMPRAASSRDGSRVIYSSNYGLQSVLGYPDHYSDVYLIEVPAAAATSAGSGNSAAARFEQDHPAVSANGAWFGNTQPAHSQRTAKLGTASGDTLSFTFNGTGVSWIGYRDPWSGIARVYVDGVFRSEVDTYSPDNEPQSVIYAINDLEPGTHTLTIEATGLSTPASEGAWVWVDAFDAVAREEQDTATATYSGNWYRLNHSTLSGGNVALSTDPGDKVDFSFSGTKVSWIGYRDAWSGIANVYIDGTFRAVIDTYSPTDKVQERIYTLSGLAPGAHALTIEVAGKKHPASEGYWVWVDAFETPP